MIVQERDDWPGVYVTIDMEGHAVSFRARGLANPYPSQLAPLLERDARVEMILVERVPAGLKRELERLRIPYLDLQGGGEVLDKGIIYVVAPSGSFGQSSDSISKNALSPFTWRASRVPRALLHEPRRSWGISELGAECQMTPGHTHRIVTWLEDANLVERDRKQVVLIDPGSLLDAWSNRFRPARDQVQMRVRLNLPDKLRNIEELPGETWVVSGALALGAYSPYWEDRSATLYCFDSIHREVLRFRMQEDRFEADVEPWLVSIVEVDRAAGMYFQTKAGLPLADPIQVYLDLMAAGGRSVDAGEHLRREVIGF